MNDSASAKPKYTIVNAALHRKKKLYAWGTAIIPTFGFIVAIPLIWKWGIHLLDVVLLVAMYAATFCGLEVGVHRLLAHKSFKTKPLIGTILAILGSMTAQGPIIYFVATHRRHHKLSEHPGDPHSPVYPYDINEGSFHSRLRGLWHAHMGWIFEHEITSTSYFASDLLKDPALFKVNQHYYLWILLGLLIPAGVGWGLTGTGAGALRGFLWGGLVRILLVQHLATYSVNSICHSFGSRPFKTPERSTNNIWLAIPTMGQAWHNNHHAFPSSPKTGFKWWQIDIHGLFISALAAVGLAWDLKIPSPDAIKAMKNLNQDSSRQPVFMEEG
jgi:stearoyl-CoA desaturase (delta-9 desaturase)